MLEAARIGDQVTHSAANSGTFWGALTGALIGAAVVGLAVVAGVFTFGVGSAVVIAGATLLLAGLGSNVGETIGRNIGRHVTHPVGPIISGAHTVFIGAGSKGAARAHADVAACKDHAPSDAALRDAGKIGKRIAQGSGTVIIEGFLAARVGDKGHCEFVIAEGCPTVFIGGPTVTTDIIDSEVSAGTIHKAQKWAINIGLMLIFRMPPWQIGAWMVTDAVTGHFYGEDSWQQNLADFAVNIGPAAMKGASWLVQAAGRRLVTQEVAQVTEQQVVQQAEREIAGSTPSTGRYGDLRNDLPTGEQAHHLNQNAAFARDEAGNTTIPKDDGIAVGMRGNAFNEPGTPHYEAHRSLEGFWNQYRRGGALEGSRPTNAEYNQALQTSLEQSGYTQQQAADLAQIARQNRIDYGLADTSPVPRIPGRINQVPPAPPPSDLP